MSDEPPSSRREFFKKAFGDLSQRAAGVVENKLSDLGALKKGEDQSESTASTRDDVPTLFRPSQIHDRPHFRPPGALAETEFLDLCSSCNKCIEVCPESCLFPAGNEEALATLKLDQQTLDHVSNVKADTPLLFPNHVSCTLCGDCMDVCPSGALLPIPTEFARIGLAAIKARTCIAYGDEHCSACYEACPDELGAISFPGGLEGSSPEINAEACTGCGQCIPACPTSPVSIEIFPRPSTLDGKGWENESMENQ